MTFDARESSRQLGKPVTLYLFVYGEIAGSPPTEAYFGYTDARTAITTGGYTYEPLAITRGSVTSQGNLDKSILPVRMPKDAGLVELFHVYPPSQVVTCVIKQGHIDDGEYLVVFSGSVSAVAREDHEAVVSCVPLQKSLRRTGLRRFYAYGCPHALYGSACQASEAAATVSSTVSALSGFTITPAGGWEGAFAYRAFRGGRVVWTSSTGIREIRQILSVSDAGVITVKGTVTNLATSDAIDIIAGCNHKRDDCEDVHNNIVNFGGQPWIPFKNPIRNYNIFG
jgi:hypothetical protein